ncbi:MAG: polysaccharide pyruvyl transferase WcaK-like protein [Paraglaciecola sp.]|jgi:polysaccharide pyruvyl transferase WcaK-like protein
MFKRFSTYIVGYYGMQNTGDDALLYATRWASHHLLSSQSNLVSSASHSKCKEFGDIQAIPDGLFRGHKRFLHYKNALQSEKVIFGGGSVFHTEADIQFKRHLITLAGRKQSRCVGVGLGPFTSVGAEKACGKFLSECGFIGVRDKQSYDIAKELCPEGNVELTFDLVPIMLCHQKNKLVEIERNGIMFNFCQQAIDAYGNTDHKIELKRIQSAVEAIEKIYIETGEPIFLVDFNGHSIFSDFQVHRRIIDQLNENIPITHILYDPNPFRVLQRIAGFKASVCMRLHASIMSFMAKTPSISINYHNKCESWCEQIGMPEEYQFDALDVCTDNLTNTLIKGIGPEFAVPVMTTQEAIEATLLNWSQINE